MVNLREIETIFFKNSKEKKKTKNNNIMIELHVAT